MNPSIALFTFGGSPGSGLRNAVSEGIPTSTREPPSDRMLAVAAFTRSRVILRLVAIRPARPKRAAHHERHRARREARSARPGLRGAHASHVQQPKEPRP